MVHLDGLTIALLAGSADLRSRITQARAVANMIGMRPDLLPRLLPMLHEALDAPPAAERATPAPRTTGRYIPKERTTLRQRAVDGPMTERRIGVLQSIADDEINAVIGERLSISPDTVRNHRAGLMGHFKTSTPGGLVAAGFRADLIA